MLSPLDMFSIGIGPSSSHTVGPMKAGLEFVHLLHEQNLLPKVHEVYIDLFGSLALTGEGHGTFLAVLNGLAGEHPATIDPDSVSSRVDTIKNTQILKLMGIHDITFIYAKHLRINKHQFLPEHSNGMRFTAFNALHEVILTREYFSIGGGFIVDKDHFLAKSPNSQKGLTDMDFPFPFTTANELLAHCKKQNMSIAELALANELSSKTKDQVYEQVLTIARVMHSSIKRGLRMEGVLPGGLNVRRRASQLYKKIVKPDSDITQLREQDRRLLAMAYALAVNEENAAFSRVVTAPTNGSAGTIPALLEYYCNFYSNVNDDKIVEFILTAGAIGTLYKNMASISAAEVGCQGEIGVASSMAAGAFAAVLGGTLEQVEKAAEIAMEHFLGMTCDPIGGLVQIPCIERNAVAVSKAIDIVNLALLEDYPGKVSLDAVIRTMLQTGRDMSMQYKETSLAGLAVNIVVC